MKLAAIAAMALLQRTAAQGSGSSFGEEPAASFADRHGLPDTGALATVALNETHHLAWDGNVVEYINETHHIDYDTEFDDTTGGISTTVSTMTHEEHNITFIPVRRPLLFCNHSDQLSPSVTSAARRPGRRVGRPAPSPSTKPTTRPRAGMLSR